jgi:hypothetical protein
MGYTTYFDGAFEFDKPVTDELRDYINNFSSTRRMVRDNDKIKELFPNWRELCFNGELGKNGEYFVNDDGDYGQSEDGSIANYNSSGNQPGLWCQWIINDNGELEWDGGEKFYNYEEWLNYLIDHFFAPLGYVLNGDIEWQGESHDDFGTIHVVDNVVTMQYEYRAHDISYIETDDLIAELKKRGYQVSA